MLTEHILWNSNGRQLLESCNWVPPDFALTPFSFHDFAFYHFAVINLSHEYDYYAESCESVNQQTWGWVRETLERRTKKRNF